MSGPHADDLLHGLLTCTPCVYTKQLAFGSQTSRLTLDNVLCSLFTALCCCRSSTSTRAAKTTNSCTDTSYGGAPIR